MALPIVMNTLASSHGFSGYRKELALKSVIHTNATANRNIDLYTDVEIFIVQISFYHCLLHMVKNELWMTIHITNNRDELGLF
jgi:hypothetical protein